ncbi:MAG: dienelactone hydrolase family protein [Gammaproteobacteria bacterium]
MPRTSLIAYQDQGTELEGYLAYDLAYDENLKEKKPAVLVCHDWTGRNEFACHKAEELTKLGYVGFALDVFGKGKLGNTTEEKMKLIQPFMEKRDFLLQRLNAGLQALIKQPQVDTNRIAAIGFCFGGLCALDLARSGAAIRGVVSFHGLLNAPQHPSTAKIVAKVLDLHGHDDPMVPPDQVLAFQTEMTKAGVDWQMDIYGHTKHAFTNPLANDANLGTVYEPKVAKRAWLAMQNFLSEVFS